MSSSKPRKVEKEKKKIELDPKIRFHLRDGAVEYEKRPNNGYMNLHWGIGRAEDGLRRVGGERRKKAPFFKLRWPCASFL
jgi:hypothetical protein